MKTTSNLGLKKPEGTDLVDIDDLNANADILDTAVKSLQDHAADAVRHITATERNTWNAKASTSTATTGAAGLMSAGDKSKLDGVATNANNYTHPSTHPPGIIVQDASNRFVSDSEKAAWNGKANLVTTPQQTTADITFYVRTDGSDSNTGLVNSAGGAFKTIQKAVNSIPYHADHLVTVSVQPGTYPEDVKIADFNGATEIYINGGQNLAAAASYVVNSFYVYGCTNQIVIQGFTASTTSKQAFAYANANFCQLWNSRAIASVALKQNGVEATNGSAVRVSACEISNKSSAIQATQGSTIISVNNIGTGNIVGIDSAEGGVIRKAGTQPGGTPMEFADNGGIITAGVLNPWGDNTTASRSSVARVHATAQSLSPSATTKINYGTLVFDHLNESDSTGTITVKSTGMYSLEAALNIGTATPLGTVYHMLIYVNGGAVLGNRASGQNLPYQSVVNNFLLRLNAGDVINVYFLSSVAVATNADPALSYLHMTRIA